MKCALLLIMLSLLPTRAASAGSCKAVLLEVRGKGIPASLLPMAASTLRTAVEQGGCTIVEGKPVADMRALIGLSADPASDELKRLVSSLMADWAIGARVTKAARGAITIEVSGHTVDGTNFTQGSTVPVANMLPTLSSHANRVVAELGQAAPSPAPATQPAPAPASQPASQPVVVAPAPPPPVAPAPPPPVAPVQQSVVAQTKIGAPTTARRSNDTQLLLAAGLRGYSIESWERGGAWTELEIGAQNPLNHLALLFRIYLGDKTSYYIGGRGEIGPRLWGPLRLSFGLDMGLLLIPETRDAFDMFVVNLHPVGAVLELRHLVLALDAFAVDLYLIPADRELGRDPEVIYGFSSGVTAGVEF